MSSRHAVHSFPQTRCEHCQDRVFVDLLEDHLLTAHGIIPNRLPWTGDTVYSQDTGTVLTLRIARQEIYCRSCRGLTLRGRLHGTPQYGGLSHCLQCCGWEHGTPQARDRRRAHASYANF